MAPFFLDPGRQFLLGRSVMTVLISRPKRRRKKMELARPSRNLKLELAILSEQKDGQRSRFARGAAPGMIRISRSDTTTDEAAAISEPRSRPAFGARNEQKADVDAPLLPLIR